MSSKANSQYKLATFAAAMGLITYGAMRLTEGESYNAWKEYTLMPFYLSMATAALVLIECFFLKKFEFMPFVVVSTMVATMTIGAFVSTEWDYYYLATLGMTGIMCLYGKIRPLILHQLTNIVLNIFVLCFLLNDAPKGYREHMLFSFLLYIYSAVFLTILFYRANKKESVAQSGLQAFSSLLKSTPNLMVIVDGKRRVRYISKRLAEFAGLDVEIATGRPLIDLFKDENLKLMFADILDADDFYSATRKIDMNNEPHYYKIIADKLTDCGEGMFIEITDMTEIVLASIEAEEARKEAEAANMSKSVFLTTMSHEIRTPMNAIIGVTEIQLIRGNLPNDVTQAFKQIHMSGHALLGIINDILDLSKIETGKLELFPLEYDVASLINDSIQLNIVRVGSKPINFYLDIEKDLPASLIGDELRLKQILNNVLSNAFKYTAAGTVKLSVSHRDAKDKIELIFTVEDTGQGMRPEDLARLFDEYSRFNLSVNRSTEGTGLGMNITKKLVDMMNGKIEVVSEYGSGSTFIITVDQQSSDNKSVIGEEQAERLRNFTYMIDHDIRGVQIIREHMPYGRVLVVDDVETNLHVARGLLAPYGLTIETALNGFEALDMTSDETAYDVVFMDHMMPGMDGVETAKKMREKGYKGIIIALTANAIAGNDKFFKSCGFDDFISKPIDIRHLNAALNKYIRDKQNPETIKNAKSQKRTISETELTATFVDKELLKTFKRDAEKAIITLSETSVNGDYNLFAITAHAMKSATANIGKSKVSELAKLLEIAGKKSDKTFIDVHATELIEELRKIISEYNNEQIVLETTGEDTEFLYENLIRISEACEIYDGGTARALLKKLALRSWKPDIQTVLDEVSEMVLCSDFDEATAKASDYSKRLRSFF